ncbi:MAG: COX15/CtaA family protein [Myxococcota bacterium]|nr:COX15/CtaA family protein [Myxococcota bacterium]
MQNKMLQLNRFQFWALVTTAATYALIAVGGLVRAAGAGLGCPDWPKCFGSWVPPTAVSDLPAKFNPEQFNVWKTWLEYLNRLMGAVIGLLIVATLILAIKHYRRVPRVLWPTVSAFLLVLFEGWLGGQVVLSELQPFILSLHLAFALIIVSLLLYATVCAFFEGGRPRDDLPPWRKKLGTFTFVMGALCLVETGLGAAVRGHVQEVAKLTPPVARDMWLDEAGMIYGVHRTYAIILCLFLGGVIYWALQYAKDKWLVRSLWATAALILFQPVTGLIMSRFELPAFAQVLHLWLGALLLGSITVTGLMATRLRPVHSSTEDRSFSSSVPQI